MEYDLNQILLTKFQESIESQNLKVVEAFRAILTKANFLKLVEILEVFFDGKESEMIRIIKETIETKLDLFLEEISGVCYHVILTLFSGNEPTYFFENIIWFYIFFFYITIKKMVCEKKIDLPNFRENIQIRFCEVLNKNTEFYHAMMFITSSPSCSLEGVGGFPDCMRKMF